VGRDHGQIALVLEGKGRSNALYRHSISLSTTAPISVCACLCLKATVGEVCVWVGGVSLSRVLSHTPFWLCGCSVLWSPPPLDRSDKGGLGRSFKARFSRFGP